MIKFKIKVLEQVFGKKVIRNFSSLGVDTASRTGWCHAVSNGKIVTFDYGSIDVKSKDIYFKYHRYIDFFDKYFDSNKIDKVIVEDTHLKYFGRKPAVTVYRKLSRFGMIIWTLAYLKKIDKEFISPSESRSALGLIAMGNKGKDKVHEALKNKIDFGIKDPDIVDSIILALWGILEDNTLI